MPTNEHDFGINPDFERISNCNTVLSAKVKAPYRASYTTNLTLKTVITGVAKYSTRRCVYEVEPENCLLLNHGQKYDLDISPESGTETLAIFFEPKFAVEATASYTAYEDRLLDEPDHAKHGNLDPTSFVERLYPLQDHMGTALKRIASRLHEGIPDELWIEDAFYDLGRALPSLHHQSAAEWTRLPAKKLATRLELYRRLSNARDYAHSCYRDALSVETLARVACMSPFHFHRMFRIAFGLTPNAYLQLRRLNAARRLLETSDLSVELICRQVGFSSLGTFGTLFRNRYGISPRQVAPSRSP